MKKLLAILAIAVAAVVAFVGLSIAWFAASRAADFSEQARRVQALRATGVDPGAASTAADRALPDEAPFDRLRMIATHNSYRKRADPLRMLFIGLAEPGESAKLGYSHPAPLAQLEAGVRSMELDLRFSGGRFVCAHVPLVDDRSTIPDFGSALEEIALWSDRRPGHAPIVLLLELKSDYLFLDPRSKRIGPEELELLDGTIASALGARLLRPDEVRGDASDLATALAPRGWPALGRLRGRILVVLHPNEKFRIPYSEGHPALAGRAMFTCPPPPSADLAFAVVNEARERAEDIARLTASRAIVRTRADADGSFGADGLEAALASGAQIVSTDYPAAYPERSGYRAELPGGGTLGILP